MEPAPASRSQCLTASLQRDVRSILTTALLAADMLLTNADPAVAKRAEIVVDAITRVVSRVG